ncbi:hypothetical protein N9M15_05880 [Bacteroidia bacterium]|nr:hypothetical protein [Bacteroidia bacterium]
MTIILRIIPLVLLLIFHPVRFEEFTIYLSLPIVIVHFYIVLKKRSSLLIGDLKAVQRHIGKHGLLFVSSVLETLPGFILLLVMQKSLSPLFIGEFRKIQSIYGLLGPLYSYILLSRISSKSELYLSGKRSTFITLTLVMLISLLYPLIHNIVYQESFLYISLLPFFGISYLSQGIVASQRANLIAVGNYRSLGKVGFFVVSYVTLVFFSIPRQSHVVVFGAIWSLVSVIYCVGYFRNARIK